MKRLALLCFIVPALYAEGLQSLMDFAINNNHMVASKALTQESKSKDIEVAQSAYYPTIDLGGAYQNSDQKSVGIAGDIYKGYATVGVDLYDGGKKHNTIEKNKALLKSSEYDTSSYKKNLQLSIAEDFYNIKSEEANLNALNEKNIQLEAELERIKKFYEVGSATQDEIDKLQAALSDNIYQIEATKFQVLSLKRLLSIKIGKKIETLDNSIVKVPTNIQKELSDDIKVLQSNASSFKYSAKTINSGYLPQIRLEDTYNVYDYGRSDSTHPDGLDNQNVLLLTFNVKLFDNGNLKKQKESILIQKMALESQIKQATEEQDINIELALSKINTTKAQINSAKSSLESAISAYKIIAEKYKAGSVNNVDYLDALSVKTNAKAQYETALNNLQIAYASYYYYTNKNIKDYIK
ncbi:TolC family protein [Sulfurospirillum arcachonense]|uniref:TolC family protein n=1 Tax=Sulfurospirillum arcachonense TaxID=57666 RepID=UPI000469C520|nr:TolC family protein [Sulfurospirillum arcachonense]